MGISLVQNTDGSAGMAGSGGGAGEMVNVNMSYGTASIDAPYFIASRRYIVKSAVLRPLVVDGAATTVSVKWVADAAAINTGTKVHSGTGDLNTGANTAQTLTLSTTASDLILASGYALGLDFSGALTNGIGVVTVSLCPA